MWMPFEGLIEQTCKYGGWDLVGVAMVEVAMQLLDYNLPVGGSRAMAKDVWTAGLKILSSVVNLRGTEAVGDILKVRAVCASTIPPLHRECSLFFSNVSYLPGAGQTNCLFARRPAVHGRSETNHSGRTVCHSGGTKGCHTRTDRPGINIHIFSHSLKAARSFDLM